MSEAVTQQQIRLVLARAGAQMWRNQVGACTDATGRLIRYGLANDSAKLNKVVKSSDLIGVVPVLITPAHVGMTLGVFTAVECKAPDWRRIPSDERATAQQAFHDIVRGVGGFAGFARSVDDLQSIIKVC